MAFTHTHINAYVIVGGDSDFLSLVEKLKQYDKKVFVIGGRAFTSVILQRNCHEFIAYENLIKKPAVVRGGLPPAPTMASSPLVQAFPIVRRALKILADREVSPQTGILRAHCCSSTHSQNGPTAPRRSSTLPRSSPRLAWCS
jgi:hypothetical protein